MKGNAINYDNYYTNPSPIWGKSKIDIELKKFLKLYFLNEKWFIFGPFYN